MQNKQIDRPVKIRITAGSTLLMFVMAFVLSAIASSGWYMAKAATENAIYDISNKGAVVLEK